jgi:ubiquinone/menaquinone biosynthesis C-methylase UbiE
MIQPTTDNTVAGDWGDIADYYDIIDIDRTSMIRFYQSLISRETRSLIELACGTGTIAVPLAAQLFQRGRDARVVGVDISPKMLRIARLRDTRIEWVQGDIRSPPVAGQFDLAICCFNSLQSLLTEKDLNSALRCAKRLIKPTGLFSFDLYQPNFSCLDIGRIKRVARSAVDHRGVRTEVREDYRYDAASQVLTIDWYITTHDDKIGTSGPRHFRYFYRQYTASEIERLLALNGFIVRDRYGDFDRSPLDAAVKKQIIVCTPVQD